MSWTIASSSEETSTCIGAHQKLGALLKGLVLNFGMGLITSNSRRHSLEIIHLRKPCLAATLRRRKGTFTSREGLTAQEGSVVASIFIVE